LSGNGLQQNGNSQNPGSLSVKGDEINSRYSDTINLTARELEVLNLMADGLSSKLIARRLWISVETVKDHKKNIYQKMAASNAVNAVAIGFRAGFIS